MEISATESQRFSFGEVADTEYVSYEIIQTENKLPYNPFLFDLQLTIQKSNPHYEQQGTSFPLSREKMTLFGRKKKQSKENADLSIIQKFLLAEIVSEKHFSIDQNYVLRDEKSKHGTYFWVNRSHPHKLQVNDTFLIAKQPLSISKVIHLPKPTLEISYQGQAIKIDEQKKLYLIGSHPKCDLIIPSLYQFEVCINLGSFTIFTHLDEEQACSQHGLWYKLRLDKKQPIVLQPGNLIFVDPYIFKVTS